MSGTKINYTTTDDTFAIRVYKRDDPFDVHTIGKGMGPQKADKVDAALIFRVDFERFYTLTIHEQTGRHVWFGSGGRWYAFDDEE